MHKLNNIGCVIIIFIIGFGVFYAKFLVPIVPIALGLLAYYTTNKLRASTFGKPQKIYELNEGQVLVEGTVIKLEAELISPYFRETCIGYLYKEIEYVPTDDDYNEELKVTKTACNDFTLSTSSGTIKIKGNELDFKKLKPRTYTEHSLKPKINDIGHAEYLLKNNDEIVIIGTAIKNIYQRFEIAKLNNELFFVTTRNKIEDQKINYQILVRLFPWMCVLYLIVNYFLFFAPSNDMPKSDVFAFVSIFGLPVLFVVFFLIGRDKKDWFSQVFQYLAGVCIFSSLLSFPLIILFYMIELEYYKIFCIVISIVSVTALALMFNYKKLVENNMQSEKLAAKEGNIYDV
ncbi:hypothetical protein [Pedobacter jamesrossensis]|uniref:RING-type E3 ubiquitin transferase n=1 Tax=Pedobacter jamesrossensis TaxID=1908238 RepID=A0ABV8NHY4_9SPHI